MKGMEWLIILHPKWEVNIFMNLLFRATVKSGTIHFHPLSSPFIVSSSATNLGAQLKRPMHLTSMMHANTKYKDPRITCRLYIVDYLFQFSIFSKKNWDKNNEFYGQIFVVLPKNIKS
jgi:hypothetical protein